MKASNKRLMILGAGPFQVPAIRKAADMGCHVVTVDYLPDNVGHQFGHQYVNCSTIDKEGVLRAARDLRIDGICTFGSDVAVPTVAYVCEKLRLPGSSRFVAETMATKHRFRRFLLEAGLDCPAFVSGDSVESLADGLQHLRPPIVVKPVDASGSRGISRLDRIDLPACRAAVLKAQGYSRSKTVCVEEFVAGTEVGGDAILLDGHVAFIAITHKHLCGFVVTGHSLPTNISASDQVRVVQQIEAVCGAIGYRTGPLNFDAIVSPDTVTLLEMSARNGGNGIPAVIERATGVDVERATIQCALGTTPALPDRAEVARGAGSFVFGSLTGGTLAHLCTPAELRARVSEVFEVHHARKVGDQVEPFEHNGNLIGYALFDCRDAADYERITGEISGALGIVVGAE